MIERSDIHVKEDPTVATVIGRGSLDYGHAPEFRQALCGVRESDRQVVVDLREASFIDSAILGCLVAAAAPLQRSHRRLKVLVRDQSHPLRVLKMVGFSAIMDIVVEPAEATALG